MRSTQDWPDSWVLVCHTRYRTTYLNRDYITALQYLAKPGRVIFSTDPVPQHKYPALVQSADVGVAFYCPQPGSTDTQDNIRHVGLSSGKLAYCLWAGLPVVVNDIPSLRRLVTTYRCGEVIDDPSLTAHAIERILSDYETYSRNAITCFNQELDLASKFDKVLDALERLP
jgi:glycosyltransferase involved in cell wall biosynthesis